jgi:hypothetical protein
MRQRRHTDARILRALAGSEPAPFWLDRPEAPPHKPALAGDDKCDLAVVGAGFTGLPVYDYVLVTEPLTPAQKESIGWERRQGLSDAGHLFHYYRLTEDDRILWGGWDAIYHYGSRLSPQLEERPRTYLELADHFFGIFPQLEGLRFTHRWAGVIDTCSRFFAFFGTAIDRRVSYALGYTGLGVGAARFGARVALDLLEGERTELTQLEMVRRKPLPFPPEPLRSGVIQLTRWSIGRAEADSEGERNLWLRTLGRFGFGFDS